MSKVFGSIYDYANSVTNNTMVYINDLKNRLTDLESRVNITETYYGEVFFSNSQGDSFGQIIHNSNPNNFIEHLVAGRAYSYNGWTNTDANPDITYSGGTYLGRTDANGKYPINNTLPIGTSATLIVDQFSDNDGMHCDVYIIIKNEDSSWSYFPIKYNTIRSTMAVN